MMQTEMKLRYYDISQMTDFCYPKLYPHAWSIAQSFIHIISLYSIHSAVPVQSPDIFMSQFHALVVSAGIKIANFWHIEYNIPSDP